MTRQAPDATDHPFSSRPRRWRKRLVRVIVALVGVAVIVAAVLAARTVAFESKQVPVTRVAPPDLDEAAAIERFAGSLRFRTVSAPAEFRPEEFGRLHAYLESMYPAAHAALDREVVGSSLLYRWRGADPQAEPVLLMSHLDVVPVPRADLDLWTHDAWSGAVADGFVWGRGALDVKCGVTGMLEAVGHLAKRGYRPPLDVYFAFGQDEEVGGAEGNAKLAMLLRSRGVRLRFVLDEGGLIAEGVMPGLARPLALVAVAEKGFATVRLTATSPGGHSSMPPKDTAASLLARAVARLHDETRAASLSGPAGMTIDAAGPETSLPIRVVFANRDLFEPLLLRIYEGVPSLAALSRTTTATTVLRGGESANVLPATADALVNFRLVPGDTPELVLRHVERVAEEAVGGGRIVCRLEPNANPASHVSDPSSSEFRLVARTIREIDPEVVVAPGLSVVATDSRHYEGIARNVFRFLPVRFKSEDLKRIHGVNERLSTTSYVELVRFYIRLFENLGNESSM